MGRLIVGLVILGAIGCGSPAPQPSPETDDEPVGVAAEATGIVPPAREPLREIFADRLELTDVHGPEVYTEHWMMPGFLFCATARSPGSVDVGLRDPQESSSTGRVTVEIQPRGQPRSVIHRTGAPALLNVGDELCLFVPPSDHPWEWFRPNPPDEPATARVALGPLRPTDGLTYERAPALAPMFVDPARIRVGDEEGFSEVRFTAAKEGGCYFGASLAVTASRAERVRVGAWIVPPDGAFDTVELRPGDTITLSRDAFMPREHFPAPAFL